MANEDELKAIKSAVQNQGQNDMEPSIMIQEPEQTVGEPIQAPAPDSIPGYQDYSQNQQVQYQDYPQQSISSDTISEISEQIVSEKFSSIRDQLEKIIDFRNTIETKMQILDDRLKQIEKIIDRLQLSILQKVGDYISNVDDIKKEVIETQKSIKALVSEKHKSKHNPEHHSHSVSYAH